VLACVTLDPGFEARVESYIDRARRGTSVNMPARCRRARGAGVEGLNRVINAGHPPVVIASPTVRAVVFQIVSPHMPGRRGARVQRGRRRRRGPVDGADHRPVRRAAGARSDGPEEKFCRRRLSVPPARGLTWYTACAWAGCPCAAKVRRPASAPGVPAATVRAGNRLPGRRRWICGRIAEIHGGRTRRSQEGPRARRGDRAHPELPAGGVLGFGGAPIVEITAASDSAEIKPRDPRPATPPRRPATRPTARPARDAASPMTASVTAAAAGRPFGHHVRRAIAPRTPWRFPAAGGGPDAHEPARRPGRATRRASASARRDRRARGARDELASIRRMVGEVLQTRGGRRSGSTARRRPSRRRRGGQRPMLLAVLGAVRPRTCRSTWPTT
jgi:hypothetical protein